MGTHNICLYKEVDKKYTGCILKTTELLDCVHIGVCVVIKSNTVVKILEQLISPIFKVTMVSHNLWKHKSKVLTIGYEACTPTNIMTCKSTAAHLQKKQNKIDQSINQSINK